MQEIKKRMHKHPFFSTHPELFVRFTNNIRNRSVSILGHQI